MSDRSGAGDRAQGLPLWAQITDAGAAALIVVALFVQVHGGFVLHPFGLRLSITSGWRLLAWAAGLIILRHLVIRRPAIHQSIVSRVAAGARAPGPLVDDVALLRREPERHSGRRRNLARIIVVFGLFVGLTALMTYPQVRRMHSVSPDREDPLLSTWRLAWVAHQLPRDPRHLFDANIFYPERHTLALSDAMVVPALTVAPLVWLGVHPVVACNILLLSGFALSGTAMFVLVRSLTQHTGAALFAGFVFAFLPYRFMHYAHAELQMSYWMPLCLWALHATVANGRIRDGLLTGLFLALQTLSSWYYGIFFATYLIPVAAALLIGAGRRQALRAIRPLAAGVVLAAIIIAPFVVPYFAARRSVGGRPLSEVKIYSATPQDYLLAHHRNVMYGPLAGGRIAQERELFQGVAVVLIAVIGLWPPLSAARSGYALGLVLAFELSLGVNGVLYGWLYAFLLPYRGLRVPARMGMIVGLTVAILAGYGAARIAAKMRSRRGGAAAIVILTFVAFLEYRSTLQLVDIWDRPPAVYERVGIDTSSVVIDLPCMTPDLSPDAFYMYFSTFRWYKLVNGYSGFIPSSYSRLSDLMVTFPDDVSLAELQRRGVDFMVVHGAFYPPAAYERVVSRLDARRDVTLVGVDRWQGREVRVYRLSR